MNDKIYDILHFAWDKESRTFHGDSWCLFPEDYNCAWPNGGQQFFIKNYKTQGFRRFRLIGQTPKDWTFITEDGIKAIIRKEKPVTKRIKLLGLLNYEGDVLKLKKDKEEYVIYDQWDSLVEIMTQEEFFDFLDGRITLTDSEGNQWNWADSHRDARRPLKQIFEYIS